MKIVGIIVEYNPLHNGHIYHINQVRKLAKPDILIACMSSTFTSRADLSLFNKYEKALQALKANVDLVVELPLIYAIERADLFAKHAVSILNLCKCTEIWCGSEENDIKLYEKTYNDFITNKDNIDSLIKEGNSYKKAYDETSSLSSNDILGYSYYKAIKDNNYNISLHTIKRLGDDYLAKEAKSDITSALAIRCDLSNIDKYTPIYVSEKKGKILDESLLFNLLKYKILSTPTSELKDIFFCDEGLENKLKDIKDYNNLDAFIDNLTSKRYTKTRIKRMLVYVLLNIKKNDANNILNKDIDYIRVLGYNQIGKAYLKTIKKDIKLYSNIKEGLEPSLDIELKASKIIDTIYNIDLFNMEQKKPVEID